MTLFFGHNTPPYANSSTRNGNFDEIKNFYGHHTKIKVLNQHFFTLGGRGPGPQKKIKKSDEHIQSSGIAQHFLGEQKKVLPNTKSYEAIIFSATLYDYLYERDVTHTNFLGNTSRLFESRVPLNLEKSLR